MSSELARSLASPTLSRACRSTCAHSSQIWTEDKHTLTCQDDPYCADFTTFKPTNEKYPGTDVDEKTHLPDFWDDIRSDPRDKPQRWAWLNHDLSAIPEDERGTIPTWKLFTTTYVSRVGIGPTTPSKTADPSVSTVGSSTGRPSLGFHVRGFPLECPRPAMDVDVSVEPGRNR